MGDLNSLSPLDKTFHQEENLARLLSQPNSPLPNLQQKLLNRSGGINYAPVQNLLQTGLLDSCAANCERISEQGMESAATVMQTSAGKIPLTATHASDVAVLRCMRRMCGSSEPTLYNPEV